MGGARVALGQVLSPELAALATALKSRDAPVTHSCAEESTNFWAHLEDWVEESEAAVIVRLVRDDDGIEAFR